MHRTQWELRKRTNEIIELQNALSSTNISLNQERKHVIILNNEIENYKLKSMEDRRRLVQMLQLAEPVEQTIKLYQDRRPEKLEKYTNSDINVEIMGITKSNTTQYNKTFHNPKSNTLRTVNNKTSNMKNTVVNKSYSSKKISTVNNGTKKVDYRIAPSDEKQQIIRTILLPNNEKNGLKDEIEILQNNLKDLVIV